MSTVCHQSRSSSSNPRACPTDAGTQLPQLCLQTQHAQAPGWAFLQSASAADHVPSSQHTREKREKEQGEQESKGAKERREMSVKRMKHASAVREITGSNPFRGREFFLCFLGMTEATGVVGLQAFQTQCVSISHCDPRFTWRIIKVSKWSG